MMFVNWLYKSGSVLFYTLVTVSTSYLDFQPLPGMSEEEDVSVSVAKG